MKPTMIVEALKAAKAAAAEFKDHDDGGTCNFDAPVFEVGRMQTKTVEALAKEAGVSIHVSRWFGARYAFVHVMQGQGMRRTVMAEAATRALKANGIETATTYYQMD